MRAGIVLVHGYSGSPDDLCPLAEALTAVYGTDAVVNIRLNGHDKGRTPSFDRDAFVSTIADAMARYQGEGRRLIVLGHSTGGVLALSAVKERSLTPDLLILASTPKRVDAAYLERWGRHRAGRSDISFTSVAQMISVINAAGSQHYDGLFPVLVLHGKRDELVPFSDAEEWGRGAFQGPVRTLIVSDGGHDLFAGTTNALVIDAVSRWVADSIGTPTKEDADVLASLFAIEPEAKRFVEVSPSSGRHLAASPSGRAAAGLEPVLVPQMTSAPTIANIEITTRCNLRCTYCARTIRGGAAEDMTPDTFRYILGILPHAYRITLVGLGETLLHPRVVDFVAEASSCGRRVALVTNAMLLDETMSRRLLDAGLESIAFSIDGSNQRVASEVRPGTDFQRVIAQVKRFVQLSKSVREISTAVFSAVSSTTVSSLGQLMDVIADLGVHVVMLSDLNFRENLSRSLWRTSGGETASLVRAGVGRAFRKNLPVLSVHALEEFGLWKRYKRFLLAPPDRLYRRSARRAWCCSPWQTVPVNVRGDVTICDCQPERTAGNLLLQPLSEIWNGDVMREHRRRMLGDEPPEECRICPRF